MTPSGRFAVFAAALALVAAGCSAPHATVRYVTAGTDETVVYDHAVFQLARGNKVQIILYHRVAAPVGEADPDFEYVFFELPERSRYGWVREDKVPVYRWVRHAGQDNVWIGASGMDNMRWADENRHMHFDFQVTMEPAAGTAGGAYVLTGSLRTDEDLVMTQQLINRYKEWLLSILGQKSPAPPGPKAKSPLETKSKTPKKK